MFVQILFDVHTSTRYVSTFLHHLTNVPCFAIVGFHDVRISPERLCGFGSNCIQYPLLKRWRSLLGFGCVMRSLGRQFPLATDCTFVKGSRLRIISETVLIGESSMGRRRTVPS